MQKLSQAATPPITCLIADTFFAWPSTLSKKFGVPYVSYWTETAVVFTLCYRMDLIRNGHFASPENGKDTITYIPGVPAIEPSDLMSYHQETDTSSPCNNHLSTATGSNNSMSLIGPLITAGFSGSTVATNWLAVSDCSQWLDSNHQAPPCTFPLGALIAKSAREIWRG
ncbi:putative UDP-glycosyltransferase 86A2 [Cocos nucifera]|uniref:Putative UDP-glycosyltransferase 86A2 n=1 Tax=Cocos nucifera TaxID=13894 RepID=A0A8K0IFM5_COCNU|nr:putative UDP-glycosyltransferase 86A2 [Cocos nucifera]